MNIVKAMLEFVVGWNWHVVLLRCYKRDNVNMIYSLRLSGIGEIFDTQL